MRLSDIGSRPQSIGLLDIVLAKTINIGSRPQTIGLLDIVLAKTISCPPLKMNQFDRDCVKNLEN
jgi:hypothetical protein